MFFGIKIADHSTSTSKRKNLPTSSLKVAVLLSALTLCVLSTPAGIKAETSPFAKGPRTIASTERTTVIIDREVKDSKSFIVLKINVPTDSKANAFALSDPARLVVDLEGASIKKSENFTAPKNGVIQQIRLGAHPSKLRVVVDLVKSSAPEYEWKATKRQVVVTFVEGPAQAAAPAAVSTSAPAPTPTKAAAPTATVAAPTATAVPVATTPPATPTPPATATATPIAKIPEAGSAQDSTAAAAASTQVKSAIDESDDSADLGDLEETSMGPPPTRVPTTFSIKGYKFEYMPDKSPVLKIVLNKPRAQAQISKVDSETYTISIKDCGVDNEDLELPQFPPHDFVGFVMVISEVVGKNIEVSVSVEEGIVLATSVHDNEIWVKKP
jgi:hypothetical protein